MSNSGTAASGIFVISPADLRGLGEVGPVGLHGVVVELADEHRLDIVSESLLEAEADAADAGEQIDGLIHFISCYR